jgi:hypothetical protein
MKNLLEQMVKKLGMEKLKSEPPQGLFLFVFFT